MATNEILPFAQGGLALVQSQATYTADAERPIGNQPGVARPDFVNKALRQSAAIAAGLAQFLADNQASNITDALTAAALSTIITNAIKAATAMPAGSIIWIPGNTAPAGTLKLNGAVLSRATYARLWTYASGSGNLAASDAAWAAGSEGKFSPGDGATNFRVPDLRGYSVRAWDDARGVDAGRTIGSTQTDQNQSHLHSITDAGHNHSINDPQHAHSYLNAGAGGDPPQANASANTGGVVNTGTSPTGISINASFTGIVVLSSGGAEVRVKNIALMPVVFY